MMLIEYAEAELAKVDLEYDGMIKDAVLDIIKLFAGQGHSGGSAAITIAVVSKLMQFQPLTPLTGEDDEWTEVQYGTWQNKRCSSVFKDAERAWDIDQPTTGLHPQWPTIVFPYTPGQDAFVRRASKIGGSDDA
jgi:hypothetical protein